MTGRSPARLLAPAALLAALLALVVIVSSPTGDDSADSGTAPAPTVTATATATPESGGKKGGGRRYTVQAGDTPSGIAEQEGVDLEALLAANPDIDPDALTVGEKLRLP